MQQVGSRVETVCSQTSQDGAGGARRRAASVGEHWPMPCALSCHVASARAALPRASRVRVSFPPPPSTPPHWAPVCRACGVEGRPRFPSATSLPTAAAATEAPTPLAPSRALSHVLAVLGTLWARQGSMATLHQGACALPCLVPVHRVAHLLCLCLPPYTMRLPILISPGSLCWGWCCFWCRSCHVCCYFRQCHF